MQVMDTKNILDLSETLASILRELYTQRSMAEAEINDFDRELNDIVHRFEYPDCGYQERNRLATRMACIRRERRALKDWLKLNQLYFEYMGSNGGEQAQKMLGNLVSIGRRVEKAKAARFMAAGMTSKKGD